MKHTTSASIFALCVVPFVILATLNSGGYRYGASDQAFYQPAVLAQLDPELFPRDTPVLAAQTRLTAADETIALAVRATGASVPAVFAALYVLALALFALGAWQIGQTLFANRWTTVALLAALTLRHAIARSGTNTLEGYFQPRLLAYGLGALAIAFFLRGRTAWMALALLLGALVHPTTAVWFALWLGLATMVAERRSRKLLAAVGVAGALAALWAVSAGPLASRMVALDPEWRRTLETKDYLFPLEWPLYAWALNLGYLPIVAALHLRRRRLGLVGERERALVLGSSVLLVVFAGALVFHAIGIALAYQLQPARIFWMFDFLAVLHVVWWLAEGRGAGWSTDVFRGNSVGSGFSRKTLSRKAAATAAVLATLSLARGVYVLYDAERPPVQLTIPDDDWGHVMAWARTTDKRSGWLADPMHAVLYGTSVRVAGERDVFVEAVKDAALGMYDRDIAVRTDARHREIEAFDHLTSTRARELAARYDLHYLVTESAIDLPIAFTSGRLRVYRLQ